MHYQPYSSRTERAAAIGGFVLMCVIDLPFAMVRAAEWMMITFKRLKHTTDILHNYPKGKKL